jgi:hypothetical protein
MDAWPSPTRWPPVIRTVAADASLVEVRSHPGHRWAVMQDPEGNEFCLH